MRMDGADRMDRMGWRVSLGKILRLAWLGGPQIS